MAQNKLIKVIHKITGDSLEVTHLEQSNSYFLMIKEKERKAVMLLSKEEIDKLVSALTSARHLFP